MKKSIFHGKSCKCKIDKFDSLSLNEKYKLIKYEFNNQLIDVYFDVLNNTIWMSQDNIAKLL